MGLLYFVAGCGCAGNGDALRIFCNMGVCGQRLRAGIVMPPPKCCGGVVVVAVMRYGRALK